MIHSYLVATALSVAAVSLSSSAMAGGSTQASSLRPAAMAQAQETFGHYLSAWTARHASTENFSEIFTEEAVIELNIPARPDWSLHIEGRKAIQQFVGDVSMASPSWSFSEVKYFPTQQENVVFAQYVSTSRVDGETLSQVNLVIVELDGSRIAQLRDLNGAPTATLALAGSRKVATVPAGDAPGQ